MTRHKGQITAKQIHRDWREQVEFVRSLHDGYGRRLKTMLAFVQGKDFKQDTVRHGDFGSADRWCFKNAADADAFHAEFGGRRFTVPPALPPKRWSR